MNRTHDAPSPEAARAVLDVVAPGSTLDAIHPLPGSYSNYTHVIEARSTAGSRVRIVIRRYATFGSYDRAEKARREYGTLELLQRHSIPAPPPLHLDDEGALLGSPGIVTHYVRVRQIESPADPLDWARTLARMLARIHAVACDSGSTDFLLDADAEAVWFARSAAAPDYMQAHPDGAEVWRAVRDLLPRKQHVAPGLVHLDYWPGNVLWDAQQITAIVDWEEAAYGDPGIDVAYCRMNMALEGLDQAAHEFLNIYERQAGHVVKNLALWELAAAARPLFARTAWEMAQPAKSKKLRRFIADALKGAA
jgi:aminoglycoside phosphotransferase (APT) family kinase protein